MPAVWRIWRATSAHRWRDLAALALIGGLMGAVALASVAGARRTESAYGRYLTAINASDVMVNVSTPNVRIIRRLESVEHRSAAAYVGLTANPVVMGKVDDAFLTNNLVGSLDGEYFRQDRMTVVTGRLPLPTATDEIALTPGMAHLFGVTVGGKVTWAFSQRRSPTTVRQSFTVVGIVAVPPALADQFDMVPTAVLPPASTQQHLDSVLYSWVALRLPGATRGLATLRLQLAAISAANHGAPFAVRRLDVVHQQAQQAIRPQSVAVAVFGAAVAAAMIMVLGFGMNELFTRHSVPIQTLRAVGATRGQAALGAAIGGAIVIGSSVVLAVVGALALSPLAPVGAVRPLDPARGLQFDLTVLLGGAAAMLVVLAMVSGVLAWRSVRVLTEPAARRRPPRLLAAMSRARMPTTAVIGARHALSSNGTGGRIPTRSAAASALVAVTSVTATAVFGASLVGLVTHPSRYGWNWTALVQSQGGYSNWSTATMRSLVDDQPGVVGWSTFGFSQLPIDGQVVPVLGLTEMRGSVAPPITGGRAVAAPGEIELGVKTMRSLGVDLGDVVTIGTGPAQQKARVVGVTTLPSIGLILADHPSLGRGAVVPEPTLLAVEGLTKYAPRCGPGCPSTVALDVAPGVSAAKVANAITAANPDGTRGATYSLPPMLGAAVVNAKQMRQEPLVLALILVGAAALALALTVLVAVRRRRLEIAVLKVLGLRRRDLRAIVCWHVAVMMSAPLLGGVLLGIVAGRWSWIAFAGSLGVVPVASLPGLPLAGGALALLLLTGLLAQAPASLAARVLPAEVLREG